MIFLFVYFNFSRTKRQLVFYSLLSTGKLVFELYAPGVGETSFKNDFLPFFYRNLIVSVNVSFNINYSYYTTDRSRIDA